MALQNDRIGLVGYTSEIQLHCRLHHISVLGKLNLLLY